MYMDRDEMAERILHLTLEILFRLTGEDYTVVKKTSSERCQDPVSEEWGRPLSPITGPPPHPLIHEDINEQKILELIYKMIELLTGEVPIRCQDVTVYFSMEEWEYLEGHKDQYKDVMMEDPQPLTSPVLSSERTTPERCSHLLLQDCKQEKPNVPQDHQAEDLTPINTTGTYVRSDERCIEEIPTDNHTGGYIGSSDGNEKSSDFKAKDREIRQNIYKDHAISRATQTVLCSKYFTFDPFPMVLSSDSSQQRKLSSHTVKKQFSCSECGKCYSRKSTLVDHKKTCRGKQPFSCTICGKCFNQKSDLMAHHKSHTEEKPYSCSECGKCFKYKPSLTVHLRSHTGVKPFSCSECGISFNHKSSLVKHEIIHTGEKPYPCSECGKCFNRKSTLTVHQRSHTGEKPFSCSECGISFNQKASLVVHVRTHTGERPFTCSECRKCFMNKSNLTAHQKTHTEKNSMLFSESKKDTKTQIDLKIENDENGTVQEEIISTKEERKVTQKHSGASKNSVPRNKRRVVVVGDSLLRGTEAAVYRPDLSTREISCLPGAKISDVTNRILNLLSSKDDHPFLQIHVGTSDTAKNDLPIICKDFENLGKKVKELDVQVLINQILSVEFLIDLSRMDRAKDKMVERILHLTLEIVFQLTGEDYTVVKKTSSDRCQAPVSEGRGRPLSPIMGPPPHPLLPEDINDQKILELTYKMIELLTGEVPIRCQDSTVYFSKEEWEYLEGHKDLYKDVMTEVPQPLTSPVLSSERTTPERCPRSLLPQDCKQGHKDLYKDVMMEVSKPLTSSVLSSEKTMPERCPRPLLPQDCKQGHKALYKDVMMDVPQPLTSPVLSSKRTTPERCPHPLLPQDCKQEDPDVPQDHQDEDLNQLNIIETFVMGDEWCKQESPTYGYPDDCTRNSEGLMETSDFKVDDQEITQNSYDDAIIPAINTDLCSKVLSSDTFQPLLSSVLSQNVKQNKHHKLHLAALQRNSIGEKPHSCFECGKSFKRKAYLIVHQRIHTKLKPFLCSECGKCFTQKFSLVIHQRIHTGEKPYSCSECGKCFNQRSSLVKHERIHTRESLECGKGFMTKPDFITRKRNNTSETCSCSECGKCFYSNSNLIRHQRTHTGEKPFSCSECGKSFKSKSNLIVHMRSHTGENPYFCSECGKSFNYKSNLTVHLRGHTGEKPFSCSECGLRFIHISSLANHEKIHTGERPFSCSECGKCFIQKSSLTAHQKSHTGEEQFVI
ncbi:uncharacterized protein ACNLHF_019306 [Anomaloglossus baeobatrachus]